jgi:glyoxylate reductase
VRARVFVTFPIPSQAMLRCVAQRGSESTAARNRSRGGRCLPACGDADGLLCLLTERIDAELFAHAPKLRAVANYAVGYKTSTSPPRRRATSS